MYFVRIKPLKERLRERTMTDREAFPYYLVYTTCMSLVCIPVASHPSTRWDILSWLTVTLITVAGTIYNYSQNGGRTGYDFIQKSIVLGWVLIIRILAIMIPTVIGIGFLKSGIGVAADQTSWLDVLFVTAFVVIYFQRLGKHLKDTNKIDGSSPRPRVTAGHSEVEG